MIGGDFNMNLWRNSGSEAVVNDCFSVAADQSAKSTSNEPLNSLLIRIQKSMV